MKTIIGASLIAICAAGGAWAQDVTIVGARIVQPDGTAIENGSIVVQDGRIVSVAAGAPAQEIGTVIDAAGMTAAPGFIDAHKHVSFDDGGAMALDLIENGFTTVLSGGGSGDGALAMIAQIDAGEINGPRIIASERLNLGGTPEEAREAIRAMAAKGIFHTGEIAVTPVPGATEAELEVLRAAVEEGAAAGVQVNVHAVSTPAMMDATGAGVRYQVHLPNKDFMSIDDAHELAETGVLVLDAISFGAPIIDVFEKDNTPRFRTGGLWPDTIAGAVVDDQGRPTGVEGGYEIVNARTLWDASGGTALGYGSDQNYPVRDVFEHELKSFMVMFSPRDFFRIIGPNSAAYLNMQDEIGTLEPGKRADIVLLDGNPYEDFHDFLNTEIVVKDGVVVVDNR